MDFSLGTEVVVIALGARGRIVEALPGGRYRVTVGSLTTVCRADQLGTVSQGKKERRRLRDTPSRPAGSPVPVSENRDTAKQAHLRSLDLHGLTVPEALESLATHIDRAIRAGLDHVQVIHGISGGRLRSAVHSALAAMPSVICAAPDPRNPGVTIAYF